MKLDGAIFDFDGTLFDTMQIWDTIGESYLRSRGKEPRENLNETFKNMSLQQAARYYQAQYGLRESTEEIITGVNAMIARFYSEQAHPKPGVAQLLPVLQRRGVKMCIATATDRPLIEAALHRSGLRSYFGEIFTCGALGCGKDRPDIFEAALKFLATPKETTLVFEDALYAVQTAKKAGFSVAAVYDRFEKDAGQVCKTADLYLHSFEEMVDALYEKDSNHRGL